MKRLILAVAICSVACVADAQSMVKKGSTNISRYVMLVDAADGTPETAVTITGIDLQYTRNQTAPAAKVDATALAATDTTHTDNFAIAVDATSSPGLYRIDWPDAAFATGADKVVLSVTATGVHPAVEEVQLVDFDPQDTVRLGLTALPNAAADAAGGLPISDAGGLDIDNRTPAATAVTNLNTVFNTDFATNYDATNDLWNANMLRIEGTDATDALATGAETGADASLATYDGPTNAEMEARTPSATAIGNIETVYNTDFATNYDVTNDKWSTLLGASQGSITFADLNVTANVGLAGGLTITQSTSNQPGLSVTGNGTGDGIRLIAGSTGNGMEIVAGDTSGDSIFLEAGNGDGIDAVTGVSDAGIRGGITGNVTGNLSGSTGSVATDGITAASIAANAIGASEIAADAIGASEIEAGAIGASELAADAIGASEVADGAIDAGALAADAIGASEVANGAIDAAALATDTITADKIAAAAITSSEAPNLDTAVSGVSGAYISNAGTASAGAAGTLTLETGASTTDGYYTFQILTLTGGTGAGQARIISDYVGSTLVATVNGNWAVTPDNTTEYTVSAFGQIPGATAPTAGEVADAVWDEDTTGHTDSDSFGEQLKTDIDAILVDTGTTLDGKLVTVDGIVDSILLMLEDADTLDEQYAGSALETDMDALATGIGDPLNMQTTTIATLASQTSFTLTAGSADNDVYNKENGVIFIITDQSTSTQKAVVTANDYVGSTMTVTLSAAPGFTIATGDTVDIIATGYAPGPTAKANAETFFHNGGSAATKTINNVTAPRNIVIETGSN